MYTLFRSCFPHYENSRNIFPFANILEDGLVKNYLLWIFFFEFSLKIWIYTISPFHDDFHLEMSLCIVVLCFVSAVRSLLILCFQPSFFISVLSGDYSVASYMMFFTCHNLYQFSTKLFAEEPYHWHEFTSNI